MADQKLTDKTRLQRPPNPDDVAHIVDVNNLTSDPNGTSFKQTFLDRFAGLARIEDITTGNAILQGGIIHITGLTYYVWATSYIINNRPYTIPVSDTITLSDGDATNPRIDVIAVNVSTLTEPAVPSIVVLEGTPAANPVKPTVNLLSQVQVSFRTIAATETTDPTTQTELIYNENTGEPSEWDNTTLTTGGDLAATADPYLGTLYFTTPATASDSVSWTNDSLISFDGDALLNFAIKAPNGISSVTSPSIQVKLINSSTSDYWLYTVGLNNLFTIGITSDGTDWQLAQIPFSSFQTGGSSTQYDRLEITFVDTPALEFDWINIQSDITQPAPVSGEVLYKSVKTFTDTELKVAGNKFFDLVPSLGVNFVSVPQNIIAKRSFGTTIFNCPNDFTFVHNGSSVREIYKWFSYEINESGDGVYIMTTNEISTFNGKMEANVPFTMYVAGVSTPTAGDSTVTITTYYTILEI